MELTGLLGGRVGREITYGGEAEDVNVGITYDEIDLHGD